jgi:hypothetical protein
VAASGRKGGKRPFAGFCANDSCSRNPDTHRLASILTFVAQRVSR